MITTLYRVRVDFFYDFKRYDSDKLDDQLLKITRDADKAEIFCGNPACGPYIFAEYPDSGTAEHIENKLIQYLTKRKLIV